MAASRDDLLIFGYTLEVNFKRRNDAKNLYRQFLKSNLFLDRYIKLTNKVDEIEKLINSSSLRLFEVVMKYDSYISMVEALLQGYGKEKFEERLCSFNDLNYFYNFEEVRREYAAYQIKKGENN